MSGTSKFIFLVFLCGAMALSGCTIIHKANFVTEIPYDSLDIEHDEVIPRLARELEVRMQCRQGHQQIICAIGGSDKLSWAWQDWSDHLLVYQLNDGTLLFAVKRVTHFPYPFSGSYILEFKKTMEDALEKAFGIEFGLVRVKDIDRSQYPK